MVKYRLVYMLLYVHTEVPDFKHHFILNLAVFDGLMQNI